MDLSLRLVLIWLMLVGELYAKTFSKTKNPSFDPEVQDSRPILPIRPIPQTRQDVIHYDYAPQSRSQVHVVDVPQHIIQVPPAPQPINVIMRPRPVQEQVLVVHPQPVLKKQTLPRPYYPPHPVLPRQPRPVINRKVIVVNPQPVVHTLPGPAPGPVVVLPHPDGGLGGHGSGYYHHEGGLGGHGSGYYEPHGVVGTQGSVYYAPQGALGIQGSGLDSSYGLVHSHGAGHRHSKPIPHVLINQPGNMVQPSAPRYQSQKI